jgi:tetratricopeptide (TPR) repeat protein
MVLKQRTAIPLIGLLLFLGTLALYLPVTHNAFTNFDDDTYIVGNAHVRDGLTWGTVKWSFTTFDEGNWGPLTWLSHALDCEWFGLHAGGHHFVSAWLHAMNAAILFWLLWSATRFTWRSLVVAALFAVHPVNVESVAWAAERKNVLSMFFFLLALLAYGWYARQPKLRRYGVVFLLYLLSLMSKPQAITFPFLLLLWDYWPLRRYAGELELAAAPDAALAAPEGEGTPRFSILWLALEKIPLILLSVADAVVTVIAEQSANALRTSSDFSLANRIETALISYVRYVGMAVWPSKLAVLYPHPTALFPAWVVVAALLVLLVATAIVLRLRRPRPYLVVGWLWFLGSMFPMIGLVQVGAHALADRFAYIPFIGLFLGGVWLAAEVAARISLSRTAPAAIASAVLVGYSVTTQIQIGYWRDSYSLFAHTLQVTDANPIAEGNLGSALMEMQRPDLALPHLERAIQLLPTFSTAHYDLGTLLQRQNDVARAQQEYQLALRYGSDGREAAQTHNNLGVLFNQLGRREDALAQFTAAIALNPNEQNSLVSRGLIEQEEGKLDAALQDFARASQVAPSPLAFYWQGRVLEEKGQNSAAAGAYRSVLKLAPNFGDTQVRLENVEKVGK